MNKDLQAINEEIDILLEETPSMDKYQRLGVLFVCRHYIEEMLKSNKSTVVEILEDKMEQIGARATVIKLEPILTEHIKAIEMIAPTISGEFIKQLKEM